MLHKDRIPQIFLQYGYLSVKDGILSFQDKDKNVQTIPPDQISMIFLEPGTSVTHAAIEMCSKWGITLNWVGESGVRMYATANPTNARTDRIWKQLEMAFNANKRLSVAKKMYRYRFGKDVKINNLTAQELMLQEGNNVKTIYKFLAEKYEVVWNGRDYEGVDQINLAINTAHSCIHGLAHCAILSCGYYPSLGFIHGHNNNAFVFDVADLVKFQFVTPIAFQIVANGSTQVANHTRHECRDMFRRTNLIDKIIKATDDCLGFVPHIEEVEHYERLLPKPKYIPLKLREQVEQQ